MKSRPTQDYLLPYVLPGKLVFTYLNYKSVDAMVIRFTPCSRFLLIISLATIQCAEHFSIQSTVWISPHIPYFSHSAFYILLVYFAWYNNYYLNWAFDWNSNNRVLSLPKTSVAYIHTDFFGPYADCQEDNSQWNFVERWLLKSSSCILSRTSSYGACRTSYLARRNKLLVNYCKYLYECRYMIVVNCK